jgi:hypothetical protein
VFKTLRGEAENRRPTRKASKVHRDARVRIEQSCQRSANQLQPRRPLVLLAAHDAVPARVAAELALSSPTLSLLAAHEPPLRSSFNVITQAHVSGYFG